MFCDPVKFSKDRKRKAISQKKPKAGPPPPWSRILFYKNVMLTCLCVNDKVFLQYKDTGKILTIKFRAHVFVAGNPAISILSPLHVLPDFPHFSHSSPCVIVHRS